jgi:hypothetical protein
MEIVNDFLKNTSEQYSVNDEVINRISSVNLEIDCPECESIILDDEQYQCTTCGGGAKINVISWLKRHAQGCIEEFGRKCFYEGREISKYNEHNLAIFKNPTYNGYLRDLKKNK